MEKLLLEISQLIKKVEMLQRRHDDILDSKDQEWDFRKYDFHLGAREAYEASVSYLNGLKSQVEKTIKESKI